MSPRPGMIQPKARRRVWRACVGRPSRQRFGPEKAEEAICLDLALGTCSWSFRRRLAGDLPIATMEDWSGGP